MSNGISLSVCDWNVFHLFVLHFFYLLVVFVVLYIYCISYFKYFVCVFVSYYLQCSTTKEAEKKY